MAYTRIALCAIMAFGMCAGVFGGLSADLEDLSKMTLIEVAMLPMVSAGAIVMRARLDTISPLMP